MAIRVSMTPDGIGAVYTSSGTLTGQDLLAADDQLGAEIDANPAFRYLLVDHSAIPEEDVDTESLKLLASRTERRLAVIPEGLVAVVAPNDILFGLSRMWAAMVDEPGLSTFVTRSREAAIQWLETELERRELPFRLA